MIKGIAGEDMEVGQAIYRGPDGKWYRATSKGYNGVAVKRIQAGDRITDEGDRDGYLRPIEK